jgi:hypothetical protein
MFEVWDLNPSADAGSGDLKGTRRFEIRDSRCPMPDFTKSKPAAGVTKKV